MNMTHSLKQALRAGRATYWGGRLEAEVSFVRELIAHASEAAGRERSSLEGLVGESADVLSRRLDRDGGVTKEAVLAFEESLADIAPLCRGYQLTCIGHAHIDMNWMWGFHETVGITIDTFRTVLDLLDRYPAFHFSQSQASVYQIVERYAPQLLERIRQHIAGGRWEVTASQWVESDMNLPSGESLARQMLYARRYLRERFDVPESAFELVFLPDTFGHNENTPEILADAGVRSLYHCRGAVGPHLARWKAPSGRSILAYREPRWYNTDVDGEVATFLPRFAKDTGIRHALCLYGVGDHGGGPTVRDIERLSDMASWPLFPRVVFGTLRSYFDAISGSSDSLPVSSEERNMIFTGCYSSQSRIKMANRGAERLLYEAELGLSLAGIYAGEAPGDALVRTNLRDSWTKTLFSHFHDILPGSGVQLTREYALGQFQETAAAALSAQSEALRRLSGVDRSIEAEHGGPESRSEGAGVGFGHERFTLAATERGVGSQRRYAVYNPLQWERTGAVELVVWDWPDDREDIACSDESGGPLDCQLLSSGTDEYWGHTYLRIAVWVTVPGFGSTTVVIGRRESVEPASPFYPYGTETWLVEEPRSTVLENELVRASFDPVTMGLVSLYDKRAGRELLDGGGAGFRVVEEEAERMTAWIVGRYQSVAPVATALRLGATSLDPSRPLQWIEYEQELPGPVANDGGAVSRLKVKVLLERDSTRLRYEVDCDWLKAGAPKGRIPQLQYALPLADAKGRLRCDIPYGTIDRAAASLDVPANSFGAVVADDHAAPLIQLTSESRQAFRFDSNALSLTLLRSSADPDPYPELGRHRFSFAVSLLDGAARDEPSRSVQEALEFCHALHPVSLPGGTPSVGDARSLLSVKGGVVATVKPAEPAGWSDPASRMDPGVRDANDHGRPVILRLYEVDGKETEVTIELPQGASFESARCVDIHERPVDDISPTVAGGRVRLTLPARRVIGIELQTQKVEG